MLLIFSECFCCESSSLVTTTIDAKQRKETYFWLLVDIDHVIQGWWVGVEVTEKILMSDWRHKEDDFYSTQTQLI